MNEQTKNYLRIGAYVVGVIVVVALGWALFRNISSDGGSATDIGSELESVAGEQRAAEKSLESVQSGLDDSIGTVGRIEQSNSDAQQSVAGIAESNRNIKAAIDDAQRSNRTSTEILADSERRTIKCQQIVQSISETAREN